ncbi:MAG: lysophospholipid acyltransferase family protein [Candidatus Nanopelagicales bacterium]
MTITKRDWRGVENLRRDYPPNDGIVVAANHLSWFDPLPLCHVLWDNGRPPRILAKDSLFDVPVLKQILNGAGQIPVKRSTDDAALAVADAVEAVHDGEAVVLYPEGTITRDPELWPMSGRTGAARIALQSGAPVIPIAQWGAQDVMGPYRKEFKLLPRKVMHLNVGAPVDLDDLRGQPITAAVLSDATTRIMDDIAGLLGELRDESPPVARLDYRASEKQAGSPSAG